MNSFKAVIVSLVMLCACSALARADDASGLLGTYYSTKDFTGTPISRVDGTINFDWGDGSPGMGIPTDHFSVCWTGQLLAPYSETYVLTTTSDDGLQLSIDGRLVISNWTDHASTNDSCTITLVAGKRYAIKMKYYENGGQAVAKLAWSSPSIPFQIIPVTQFFQPTAPVAPSDVQIFAAAMSRVSPAWVEGMLGHADASVTVSVGGSNAAVTRESGTLWYVNTSPTGQPLGVPLSTAAPVTIAVQALSGGNSASVNQSISWEKTDLANLPYGLTVQALRPGDSLLLTAHGAGASLDIDTAFDGQTFKPILHGVPNQLFPRAFSTPGTYDVRARINGVEVGKLTVVVVTVDLQGPIACQLDYRRTKDVTTSALPIGKELVAYTADDTDRLLVSTESSTTTSARLKVQPVLMNRRPILQARLLTFDGPIVTQQPIDVFTLHTSAEQSIAVVQQYNDGSILAEAQLVMNPLIHDLDIKMWAFVAGVTFDDSSTERNLSSNLLSPLRDGSGAYMYRMIRGPNVPHGFCHEMTVYQRGVQVSR
jgi:PA14 domain